MASDNEAEDPAEEPGRAEGTSSVRVALVVFLGSLLVLGAMGIYWLAIRL